jgi:drug/metabolite transporter (DMT)-like permease
MLIGELAALGTAISFSFGSVLFTFAGRRLGSPLVNRVRLLVALLMIMLMHLIATGQLLPLNAAPERWFWLGLSGLIGFVLGDAALFQGFVMVGPRLSMLMMALAPVIATVLGWAFLGEILSEIELLGIALTVSGIIWVVLERSPTQQADIPTRTFLIGLMFAFGGAVGQATGLVTSSIGLRGDFLALSGNVIRLSTATLAIWTFTALQFRVLSSFHSLRSDLNAVTMLIGGSLTGPVIGVWLSLIAVQLAPVGIASTIMSLTPTFLLPISYVVFHEQITQRIVLGTVIAFAGTALLFL